MVLLGAAEIPNLLCTSSTGGEQSLLCPSAVVDFFPNNNNKVIVRLEKRQWDRLWNPHQCVELRVWQENFPKKKILWFELMNKKQCKNNMSEEVYEDAESVRNAAVGCHCRLSLPMRTSECQTTVFTTSKTLQVPLSPILVVVLNLNKPNTTVGTTEKGEITTKSPNKINILGITYCNWVHCPNGTNYVDWHYDTDLASNSTRTNMWGIKTSVSGLGNQDIVATCKLCKSLRAKGNWNLWRSDWKAKTKQRFDWKQSKVLHKSHTNVDAKWLSHYTDVFNAHFACELKAQANLRRSIDAWPSGEAAANALSIHQLLNQRQSCQKFSFNCLLLC